MTPWGGRVEARETTASTMDDARALEDSGAPDGSLVWARHQTAGRGRLADRAWVDEPGSSLLFTAYWSPARFRVPEFAPSLTVGLGVCLWLEQLGLAADAPVSLKWPNDVYLGEKKVAGILVRRRLTAAGPQSIHAGIGINLSNPGDQTGFRRPATSLAAAGVTLSPEEALEGLLPALAAALVHPDPRGECEARLWRRGAEAELSIPDAQSPARVGLVAGVDPAGRLLWRVGGVLELVSSGE